MANKYGVATRRVPIEKGSARPLRALLRRGGQACLWRGLQPFVLSSTSKDAHMQGLVALSQQLSQKLSQACLKQGLYLN